MLKAKEKRLSLFKGLMTQNSRSLNFTLSKNVVFYHKFANKFTDFWWTTEGYKAKRHLKQIWKKCDVRNITQYVHTARFTVCCGVDYMSLSTGTGFAFSNIDQQRTVSATMISIYLVPLFARLVSSKFKQCHKVNRNKVIFIPSPSLITGLKLQGLY